ncbi:MAG: hypothetical protein WAW17_02585 [Rhodococcus sp. (in: high G+C Gram-positive bacteria)]|uniref:hypothetical protein n=1 Tax=Rhodococcus sp. TaxID=1831 RepID=UPI003BAEAB35
MARTATATELAQAQGRPLGFADVPEHLRPSRWKHFDAQLPTGIAGRRRHCEALRLRQEAYHAWLAENDLANGIGQPALGWDSTRFARWEYAQEGRP